METREKLLEVRDIIAALLDKPRCHKSLLRAHDLLESAIGDFFSDEDDVAVVSQWFDDEPPPFPAA